jgi:hypothetical protein
VLDYSTGIGFPEMISQLLNYTDEKKKFFDIVAGLGMCELGDEELSLKKPTVDEPVSKKARDIGWFTDQSGYKHYGIIPITPEERYAKTRPRAEDA